MMQISTYSPREHGWGSARGAMSGPIGRGTVRGSFADTDKARFDVYDKRMVRIYVGEEGSHVVLPGLKHRVNESVKDGVRRVRHTMDADGAWCVSLE